MPPESDGTLKGPGKCQRPSGGTADGGQAKRPRPTRQLRYGRDAQEGLRMAIISDGYPEMHVSKDNCIDIQQAIGRLVNGLPEEGFTPRLIDTCWGEGAAIVICQRRESRNWLGCNVPIKEAWEGSKLKMVGLEDLPTYKRVVAWFPGPVEDTECYLQ
jgi:hypothetical protein